MFQATFINCGMHLVSTEDHLCGVFLQLRSSFKQAFSKKKTNKTQSSHDEFEEMTDSSLPSSPKLQHTNRQTSTIQPLLSSPSTTE